MASVVRRFLLNQQNAICLNSLYKSSSNARQLYCIQNRPFSIGNCRVNAFTVPQNNVCNRMNPIICTSIRLKSNKRNRKQRNANDDEDEESDDDDDSMGMDSFREGNSSDRNLVKVKVQTLRLDTVIKAGLGYTKKKVEKLFYESKIRLNGKKVTKKSLDILKECEIDVIKGPSPENSENLLVGRIEILAVKSDGNFFELTMRRNKNLTIENYISEGRYTESS